MTDQSSKMAQGVIARSLHLKGEATKQSQPLASQRLPRPYSVRARNDIYILHFEM